MNLIDPFSLGVVGVGAYEARSATSVAKLGPSGVVTGAFWFGFVGLGEEGLFRGFLYPGLSDVFNSHLLGAATSSALFALSHLTNSQAYYHSGLGLSELFLLGMVFCWQATTNNYDIRHNIFAHSWYDIIIDYDSKGTRQAARSPAIPGLGLRVSFPID